MHRYHINVFWSDEDGCWIATAPDLEFVSAHGDTPAQAVSELDVAIEGCLAVLREDGQPVPEPRYRSEAA
ncbi:MAG TPA: type II toxin-antitoxin system HicB family antitoxin [Azospirillum sp.]